MRFRPASRVVMAGASLAACWGLAASPARADILVGSTLIPTSSVVTSSAYLPTSFVSSSSYIPTSYVGSSVFPTSYVSSSAYLPTSYVVPTSAYLPTSSIIETGAVGYYPTTSVGRFRGGLFRPRRFVERTTYYGTSTGFLTPTAYYSPTSYVTPTAYYSPTSYVTPTAYYASSYIPTSYVVPSAAAAVLPTTYLSSSLITPTSYLADSGLIATTASAAACCDTAPPQVQMQAPAAAVNPTRTVAPPRPAPGAPGRTITSQPGGEDAAGRNAERPPSSAVTPAPVDEAGSTQTAPAGAAPIASPPVEPAPRPGGSPPPVPTPDKSDDVTIPPPGGSKPSLDEGAARTSYKPANYRPVPNILRGRVVSYETGRAEEFVTVVLVSRTNAYDDRPTQTDADGEFKISLPDGDWAVKVTMPSGSVYTLGRAVTATGGRVVDRNGNRVGEFLITR